MATLSIITNLGLMTIRKLVCVAIADIIKNAFLREPNPAMEKCVLKNFRVEDNSIMADMDGEPVQVASMNRTRWSNPDGGRNDKLRKACEGLPKLFAAAPELRMRVKQLLHQLRMIAYKTKPQQVFIELAEKTLKISHIMAKESK